MRIVAVQLDMAWEDKEENHRRATELLAAAAIEPGSLIVMPEMFDTGFSMNAGATAQGPGREGEAFLRDVARRYDSAVLAGVAGPLRDGMASNEAVAFAPDGSELARYRKMQPFTLSGEDRIYGRGDRHRLFTWGGVAISPFLCYDLRFPELFRPAVHEGAELIVVMACWPSVRSEHWVRLLQARAIENLACVVGVNRCGSEPNLIYDGRSAIFDHMGVSQWEADGRAQVGQVELDIEALRRWRAKFPALRDMRPPSDAR